MNDFEGLDAATLALLKADYVAAVRALALNQSYALNGRSLTRASLPEIRSTLSQILGAIADLDGTTASETYVNFTGNDGSYPNSF